MADPVGELRNWMVMGLLSLRGLFRVGRLAALGVVIVLSGLSVSQSAHAQTATEDERQSAKSTAPVMLVLDASGSMMQSDPSGGTKLAAAKSALKKVIDTLPSNAEVGLMVYGSKVPESRGKAASCQDIKTVFPLGTIQSAEMKSAVDGITARGYTPIGASLKKANQALPAEGPRSIVLVSDGEETCAPPAACDAAEEIMESGTDLVMHTVGFDVSGEDEAKRELQCIARTGNGDYIDAPDAASLNEQLPTIVTRAARPYDTAGMPIDGAEDYADAPPIEAGQYLDAIDPGQTKHYQLHVPRDYTVHFAATTIVPTTQTNGVVSLYTRILDPQGKECAEQREGDTLWHAHVTSSIAWSSEGADDCRINDTVVLAVEREGPDNPVDWTWDLELLVILEPPVTGYPGPEADDSAFPFEQPQTPEQPVTGGGSFNSATELSGSGVYAEELVPGEMATFKIKVDWGEALAVQASVDSTDVADVLEVRTSIAGPTRWIRDYAWSDEIFLNDERESSEPIETARVLYNNRNAGPSIAGYYYITLEAEPADENGVMPTRLYVSKGGEQIPPPEYARQDGLPEGPLTGEEDTAEDGDQKGADNSDSSREKADSVVTASEDAVKDEVIIPLRVWVILVSSFGLMVIGGVAVWLGKSRK